MSFYDDASLVVIPSGFKTSKVYAEKPTDGSGDLSFTRTGDTATRIAPNGLLEKVRTNLVLQSNSFNTTWATANASVTSGQSGYDGTNNAWELNSSASGGRILQSNTQAGLQTFSAYAKGSVSSGIRLYAFGTVNANAYFNLNLGTVGAIGGSGVTAKIEAVGGGWYRCSISFNQTNVNVRLYTSDNANAEAAGTIYIQNAQLETGDIATDYIGPTLAAAVSVGPVANVPRLDYLGSSCGRLLLEPQTTALNQFSEQIDNAWWSKTRVTISANATATLDPSGYNGSDLMVQDAADTNGGAFFRILTFAAGAHTFSVFAKMDEVRYINLAETASSASTRRTWFDLQSGVVGTTSAGHTAKIENYGNGWYRCSITFTANAGTFGILTYLSDADNSTTAVVSKGSYFWGANLTATSYLQSYIPTLAASATRGADACSKTGISSLIGQTEGTLFLDFVYTKVGKTNQSIVLGGASNYSNTIYLLTTEASGDARFQLRIGGTALKANIPTTFVDGTRYKIAMAYKSGDSAFYVNGVSVGTSATSYGAVSEAISQFVYNWPYGGDEQWCSPISQTLLFPTRLTNSELAELTSL
jgi:hypothetical protein